MNRLVNDMWFNILKIDENEAARVSAWIRNFNNAPLESEIERQKKEGENIIGPFFYKRQFVIANTGSGWIPFYKSSGEHGIKDMWSPFGGFTNDDWVIKPLKMEMFQDDEKIMEMKKIIRDNDRARGTNEMLDSKISRELDEAVRRTSDPNVHSMTNELAGKTFQEPVHLTREEANNEIREKYGEIGLAW